MNKIIVLSSIILSLFFISCNKVRNVKIIDRDSNICEIIDFNNIASSNSSITISDLIDSMYIIKLETNENSLISNVEKVVFGNEYIYVLDKYKYGSVAIFDFEGHFIRRLVTGNGPGEINVAENITYDCEHNELYVYQTDLINKYTSDGRFIDNFVINYFIDDFCIKKDTFFCVQCEIRNFWGKFSIFKTDTLFNEIDRNEVDIQFLSMIRKTYFNTLATGEILVSRPFDNVVYLVNNDNVTPKYKFNCPASCQLKIDDIGIRDYDAFISILEKGKYYFDGAFFENSNYQIIFFSDGFTSNVVYRNISTGKYRCGVLYNKNDNYLNILQTGMYNGVFNDFFVFIFEPHLITDHKKNIYLTNPYLSSEDKEIIQNITPDDNPLIIFYKLKDMPSDSE